MRRSILDIFLFLLVIISTAACNNDLPFDLKENPPKLVMNAIINADSTYNTLFLNLTGRNQIGQIKGATVEVRINGSLSETLRPDPHSSDKGRFYINSAFHPGDVVRIDAMTDDGEHHAWAEVTVPQPIGKIEKVDTAAHQKKESVLHNAVVTMATELRQDDISVTKSKSRTARERRIFIGSLWNNGNTGNTIGNKMTRPVGIRQCRKALNCKQTKTWC